MNIPLEILSNINQLAGRPSKGKITVVLIVVFIFIAAAIFCVFYFWILPMLNSEAEENILFDDSKYYKICVSGKDSPGDNNLDGCWGAANGITTDSNINIMYSSSSASSNDSGKFKIKKASTSAFASGGGYYTICPSDDNCVNTSGYKFGSNLKLNSNLSTSSESDSGSFQFAKIGTSSDKDYYTICPKTGNSYCAKGLVDNDNFSDIINGSSSETMPVKLNDNSTNSSINANATFFVTEA